MTDQTFDIPKTVTVDINDFNMLLKMSMALESIFRSEHYPEFQRMTFGDTPDNDEILAEADRIAELGNKLALQVLIEITGKNEQELSILLDG